MAKLEGSSASRHRFFRLALWIVMALGGLVAIGVIGLMILSASVNRSGEIPAPMRAEPAAIAKLRRKPTIMPPAATSLPTSAALQTLHSALASEKPLGQGLYDDRWVMEFQQKFRFLGVPVTAEQASWLRSHSGLLDRLHLLVRDESRRQTEALLATLHISRADALYLGSWTGLLVQEAQWKMQQGDYAGARAGFLDALRLLDLGFQAGTSRATIMDNIYVTCLHLINGIENPQWPNGQWAGIPKALEALDAKLFDTPAVRNEIVEAYLTRRPKMIADLDGPWNSQFFLRENIHERQFYVPTGIYWPNTATEISLPRPFKLMSAAAKAMALKRRSAELLEIYDRDWQLAIERSRMTYPERFATRKSIKGRAAVAADITLGNANLAARAFEKNETTVHLARVGLLWRLDPQRARGLKNEPLRGRPHHPWRDLFSEQPFQLDETSSSTLIFSLGYTLKPEDGRRSPGLHIKLPAPAATH